MSPRCPLLLLALLLAGTPALALEVKLEVGLGGVVPTGGWAPVVVRCRLAADEPPFVGRVVFDRPSFGIAEYAVPISLDPGREAVVRMTVPVGVGRDYQVHVQDPAGATVASSAPSDSWRTQDPTQRMALLLGKRGLGALNGTVKNRPKLVRLAPGELPLDRRSLGFVAAIFVSGDPVHGYAESCDDPKTVAVLRSYVEEGGRLIFLSRPGATPPWAGTRLEELVPVSAGGFASLPAKALRGFVGEAPAGDVAYVQSTLRAGARWTQRSGDRGLVAERELGEGKCVFLAMDVDAEPVRRGSKLGKALSALAPLRNQNLRLVQEQVMLDLAQEAFEGRRSLGPLAFALIAAALLLHVIVLGPLPGLLKRRGPWVAMTLPPLASLVIGLLVLLVAALARSGGEARGLSLVFHDPAGGTAGRRHLELGLFAGEDTAFAFDLPEGFEPTLQERSPLDLLAFRSPGPSLHYQEGLAPRLGPVAVPSGGVRQVRLVGPAGDGPRLQLSLEGGRLRVRSLETERTLEGLFAIKVGAPPGPGRIESLEPLPPGGELGWSPDQAPPVLPDQPIEGDVFADDAACTPLLHRIAERLTVEYLRSPGSSATTHDFPELWVGQLRRAEIPLSVEERDQPLTPEQASGLEVHLLPCEAP